MIKRMNSIWRTGAYLALLGAFLISSASVSAAGCLDQTTARNLVNSGQVLSLGAIASMHNIQIDSARLCQQGGRYVYELMVRGYNGDVMKLIINAQNGQRQ